MRISDWSSDVCSSDLPTQPFADYVLYVQRPPRVDQQPVSMASAQYGQRGRSGTIDAHALHLWSGLADQPGGFLRILGLLGGNHRSEEHTSELQSLMRISYAVFCLQKTTIESTYSIQ